MFSRSRRNFGLFVRTILEYLNCLCWGSLSSREVEDQIQAFDRLLYRKSKKMMAARADTPVLSSMVGGNLKKDVPLLGNTYLT